MSTADKRNPQGRHRPRRATPAPPPTHRSGDGEKNHHPAPAPPRFIHESRDHFHQAGMELLMALKTFGEGWLALINAEAGHSSSWAESLRTIVNELAHLTEAYAKSKPQERKDPTLLKLVKALDSEIAAIAPPMDEHRRAYRDALLAVKRVLARALLEPGKKANDSPASGFRPIKVE